MSKFKIDMGSSEDTQGLDEALSEAFESAAASVKALLDRVAQVRLLDFNRPGTITEMIDRFAETETEICSYDAAIEERKARLSSKVHEAEVRFAKNLRATFERYKPLAVYAGVGVSVENLARTRKVFKWMHEQIPNWVESNGRAKAYEVFRRYVANLKATNPTLDVQYLDDCIEDRFEANRYRSMVQSTTVGLDIDTFGFFGHLLGLSVETLKQLGEENKDLHEKRGQ